MRTLPGKQDRLFHDKSNYPLTVLYFKDQLLSTSGIDITLNPNTKVVGSPDTDVAVTGTGFTRSSVVQWNGADRVTRYVSATELRFTVPASDMTRPSTNQVQVVNPGPGGGTSNTAPFTVTSESLDGVNITLNPNTAVAGSGDTQVIVTGRGFNPSSVVEWRGTSRTTTFISATELRFTATAADLRNVGVAAVQVVNPDPRGSRSNNASFTVTETVQDDLNGVAITLNPDNTLAGSSDTQITVFGKNFVNGATVQWNGQNRTATFINSTELRFTAPAADLVTAGTAQVTVTNPNGTKSNAATFTINNPSLSGLNITITPNNANAGSPNTEITVNGTGFVANSIVRWNGQDRTTTYVSATQLKFTAPAADLANEGTAQVTVTNPAPGGGTSNPATFTINSTDSSLNITLNPNNARVGDPDTVVTVSGTGFVNGSVVQWNGQDLATTFISASALRVTATSADLAKAGVVPVKVKNPDGRLSNTATFTINNSSLTGLNITINPEQANVGDPETEITITGTNFVDGAIAQWDGQDRPTTFVSATQLKMRVPASDLTAVKTASIRVVNPGPGGGTSNPAAFNVVDRNSQRINITINPDNTLAGSNDTEVTVTGTGFTQETKIAWNGQDRQTTYVSNTQMKVLIPASDLKNAGYADITAITPGVGTSNPARFTINNPDLTGITITLEPDNADAGSPDTPVKVTGNNFTPDSKVQCGGVDIPVRYVSATELTVTMPESLLANPGTCDVVVINPAPGGGKSNPATFTINSKDLTNLNITLDPNTAQAGSPDTRVKVTGTGFNPKSQVQWNGQPRDTVYVSATELSFVATSADLANAGTAQVKVVNPDPRGSQSNEAPFTITSPSLSGLNIMLNPESAAAGSGDTLVTVTGRGFNNTSRVQWNGVERATTYVSATELRFTATASDLASAGTARVRVVNPDPGGSASNEATFTIYGANLTGINITLNPDNTVAGSSDTQITVFGRNFVEGAVVQWNGAGRIATFISASELRFTAPAADLASAGTAQVKVINPNGTTSNEATFTINNPSLTGISITLTPNNATAGSGNTDVTVRGSGFIPNTIIRWNDQDRTTTYVSATEL